MIAVIGIMIGFYIITRGLSFVFSKGEKAESGVVQFFAVITIAVAVFGVAELVLNSISSYRQSRSMDRMFYESIK